MSKPKNYYEEDSLFQEVFYMPKGRRKTEKRKEWIFVFIEGRKIIDKNKLCRNEQAD